MNKKNIENLTLESYENEFSFKENKSNLNISFNRIAFIFFIFLMIVIGFSLVGLLKTFETDLINNFPEIEYVFEKLDEQLIYVSETVKNIITIVSDLINSY